MPQPAAAETPDQRAARIAQLRLLVQTGRYVVRPETLIPAVLFWDPSRSAPRQDRDLTLANRQAYMREYMRRRRAAQALVRRLGAS
jgi:hypothetical protein